MRLEYDKGFDHINIMVYREHGMDNPKELRHVCTVCKTLTCIDDSYSRQGHKLICFDCAHRHLKSFRKIDKWLWRD